MTFFLQQILKRALVSRENWEEPGSAVTFVIAALSKVMATSVTYPFQIAKARVMVSSKKPAAQAQSQSQSQEENKNGVVDEKKGEKGEKREANGTAAATQKAKEKKAKKAARRETIFSTVLNIARTEGVPALYDGIGGELLKAFFNHGLTMVSKDIVHGLIIQLYFAVVAALKDYKKLKETLQKRGKKMRADGRRYYMLMGLAAQMVRQRGLMNTLRMAGLVGKGKSE